MNGVTNVKFAGLGGQGIVTATDILAGVAFAAGLDVKKAEVHGMSQRGGAVTSDVRFGPRVLSPLTPEGASDILVVVAEDQVEINRRHLKPGGVLIAPSAVDASKLQNRKCLNVALLGVLSRHLPFPEPLWLEALRSHLPPSLHDANEQAFALGRG
jgi:indolepyruvate ferredoxin oxidoreductase beta subunit